MMFSVGQELIFVPNWGHRKDTAIPVRVIKINRKWITVDGYRFDRQTMRVDGHGYSSPGKIYLSVAEWESETATLAAWASLKNKIGSVPNEGVTLEDIVAAAALLKINL